MTQKNQIYKCEICGNIVEMVHEGAGELVCCGQPMKLQEEKISDEGQEKHVPIIEQTENGVKIKIGSIPHPMEEKHYIEWIEIIVGEKVFKKFLKPNDAPEAEFRINAKNIIARAYCNIHGLWKSI